MKLQTRLAVGMGVALVLLATVIVSSTARMSIASAQTPAPNGQSGPSDQAGMTAGWQNGGTPNAWVGYGPGEMMRGWIMDGEMLGRRIMGGVFGHGMGGGQNGVTPVPFSGYGRGGGMMGSGMWNR